MGKGRSPRREGNSRVSRQMNGCLARLLRFGRRDRANANWSAFDPRGSIRLRTLSTQHRVVPTYEPFIPRRKRVESPLCTETANRAARDVELTARLWRVSTDLVGLTGVATLIAVEGMRRAA